MARPRAHHDGVTGRVASAKANNNMKAAFENSEVGAQPVLFRAHVAPFVPFLPQGDFCAIELASVSAESAADRNALLTVGEQRALAMVGKPGILNRQPVADGGCEFQCCWLRLRA